MGSACCLDGSNVDDTFGNKVRGGRWHALIDKVYAELNLFTAARKVTAKEKAAGVDGESCEAFEEHLLVETRQLAEQIKDQTYRPGAVRRVHIPKPGRPNETRPLGMPGNFRCSSRLSRKMPRPANPSQNRFLHQLTTYGEHSVFDGLGE